MAPDPFKNLDERVSPFSEDVEGNEQGEQDPQGLYSRHGRSGAPASPTPPSRHEQGRSLRDRASVEPWHGYDALYMDAIYGTVPGMRKSCCQRCLRGALRKKAIEIASFWGEHIGLGLLRVRGGPTPAECPGSAHPAKRTPIARHEGRE